MDKINIFLTLNRLNYYCVCGSFISSFCETNLSIRQKKKTKKRKVLTVYLISQKRWEKKNKEKNYARQFLKC